MRVETDVEGPVFVEEVGSDVVDGLRKLEGLS